VALVVFMATDGRRLNLEVVEQLLRLPRVFAGDSIHAAQHIESTQSDVAKIADGRGYEIEAGSERLLWRSCIGVGS